MSGQAAVEESPTDTDKAAAATCPIYNICPVSSCSTGKPIDITVKPFVVAFRPRKK